MEVEVDGRRIDAKSGDMFRNVSEMTGEIRGAHAHAM
jgi:hypothetical protein